jgi:hypothetical protein
MLAVLKYRPLLHCIHILSDLEVLLIPHFSKLLEEFGVVLNQLHY